VRLPLLLILLSPVFCGTWLEADDLRLHRPAAVVVDREHNLAWVANRGNGHLSAVDFEQRQIVLDRPLGKELSDLVQRPGHPELLAADAGRRELILLQAEGDQLEVLRRLPLPLEPDRLAVSPDGNIVGISSPSVPALCVVVLTERAEEKPAELIPLSVPVRNVLPLPDGKFLAADRFGGRLFVIDPSAKSVVAEREFRGHNIRGLALDQTGESVFVSHQILSRLSQSTYEDIHWGMLLQNVISRIPLASLADDRADLNRARRLIHVGDTGDGAADPSDIIPYAGAYAVAASGADKLFVRTHLDVRQQSVATGARPTRLAPLSESRILVLNEFAGSLQIVEPKAGEPGQFAVAATIGGPQAELSAAERGERLFYSAELTHDRWFSCNSCHVDGHSPDLFADTLGDGDYGNPKRIPSLLGVAQTGPWGWTGSITTLEEQIAKSLDTTMHGGIDDDETVNDLAAYLKTLPPPAPPKPDDDAGITRGRELFASLNCTRCHQPPAYTTRGTYDVGLKDENGLDHFNPPSLRGVSRRRNFLHDGRAKTLKDAILQHGGTARSSRDEFEKLSEDDRRALLKFLQGL